VAKARRILDAARARPASLSFSELQQLARAAGFSLARISGDHFIYTRPGIPEIINLQPRGRKNAKPYQVRQVVELIDRYRMEIE
jgi:hypothetical protein